MDDIIFEMNADDLPRKSVSGAVVTSVAQGIRFVLMLGSQVLMARLLLPQDFGIVAMVAPALGLATTIADFGLLQAVVQRPVVTRRELNSVFWVNMLISAVLMGLLILLAPVLAWIYGEPRLIGITVVFAALVVVSGSTMLQAALLNRMMNFRALSIAEIASLTCGLGAGLLGAVAGLGYWALVLNPAATALTSAVILWSYTGWAPSRPSISRQAVSILSFGRNLTITNIALYLNTTLDNMLIGWFLGQNQLGLYDRAWKLVVLPYNQLMAPIGRVAVPTLSRLTDDAARYRNVFQRMLQFMLLVSLPGLIVVSLGSETLIGFALGAKWVAAAPAFSWLCFGAMITPINGAMFWAFVSQGRSRDHMIFGTVAAVINLVAYVIGVRWGILGVARTSAVSVYLLQTPLLIWAALRDGPLDRTLLVDAIAPFLCAGLVIAAMVSVLDHSQLGGSFLGLVALTVLAYAVEMSVVLLFSSGRTLIKNARSMVMLIGRRRSPEEVAL